MTEATAGPAILAEQITFCYQEGTTALNDVTLEVGQGEFVAMLASNGSGKTTLLEVLAGLLTPQNGSVKILSRDLADYSSSELYQRVGIVLQDPTDQLFAPTVRDDVAFGPRNLDLAEEEVQRRVQESLTAVGAEHLAGRAIHQLSFGERKRVCLAGVLAMQPAVLILDEPTAGLDPAGEAQMLHLLNRLNREVNMAMIMATHSVDLLPLFADRIYVLRHGKVLGSGTPEVVFGDHALVDSASLRLPYISKLVHELKHEDRAPISGLPLTMSEARRNIMAVIPQEILLEQFDGQHE